jgi:menaquinone-dependent protoporphyrinogen oxidase
VKPFNKQSKREENMTAKILLAYATSYGSTQEVAQSMAETLRGCGIEIDIEPAKKVKELSGYSMVILGAPLYMFHWHQDALHFLKHYRSALVSLPMAIFAIGPFHNTEEELKSAREQLDKERVKFDWLRPAAVEVFAGKFDPASLRFPYNLIPALKKMPASDERDWEAMGVWVKNAADGFMVKEK